MEADWATDGLPSDPATPQPGAPKGNTNAVRHGGRSKRFGVVLARLGNRFRGAYVDALRLRAEVESLLRQRNGSLTLSQVARIQTLVRLEQSCRACELLIRDTPAMDPETVRQHRHSIVQWSCQRDRLLAELLGDSPAGGQPDPWREFYAQQAQQAAQRSPASVAAPAPEAAPDATASDVGGPGA